MGISNKLSDKRLRRTVPIIAACYEKALYKMTLTNTQFHKVLRQTSTSNVNLLQEITSTSSQTSNLTLRHTMTFRSLLPYYLPRNFTDFTPIAVWKTLNSNMLSLRTCGERPRPKLICF